MIYHYLAKTKKGESQQGEIETAGLQETVKVLREKGLIVLSLKTKKPPLLGGFLLKRVSLRDKIIFTQQLALMIKSGVPIVEVLNSLKEQTANQYFSQSIGEIGTKIKGGMSLSSSLEAYPSIFPVFYIKSILSGEKTGKLEEILARLADQMEKDYELMSKIRAALIYPILILITIAAVLALVVIFVIPQIKIIFEEMDVQLPLITRIIINGGDFLRRWLILIIILIISLYFLLRQIFQTPQFRLFWDQLKLKIPLLGGFYKKIYMARFSRSMATLVAAGLPMLDIFETLQGVIDNLVYQNSLKEISHQVETGIPLSSAIKKDPSYPPMISHLLAIGERSGNLDFVLNTLADFYEKEVENISRNLATLIEPVLLIIMGVAVGLVLAAVMLPIYNLVQTI